MVSDFVEEANEFLRGAGYEQAHLVRNFRYTAPIESGGFGAHTVDLAAFANTPHDMRSACVAAFPSNPQQQETLSRLRYLTSPLAIIGYDEKVELWPIRTSVPIQPLDVFGRLGWQHRVSARLSDYSPDSIIAAKQNRLQFDFVDSELGAWTRNVTATSLKNLLEELVHDGLRLVPRDSRSDDDARNAILRLIFHLFACRVLEDKGVIENVNEPRRALELAHERFSTNITPAALDSPFVTLEMVQVIFEKLRAQFSFETLTTDILAHSYENALVTKTVRRELGVYYTPPVLTQYILKRLPIEVIPENQRLLWDPCCGCGSFLLAGFDRLARLLPETYSGQKRHEYLRDSLFGSDIDPFACELAALALVLSDVYHKNGWKIEKIDATKVSADDLPKTPTIIVTNLPFKEIKAGVGVRRELSGEILIRLIDLAPPSALLGIVLPQSFLDNRATREARAKILETCDVLELGMFPAKLFDSATETAVLLLQRRANDEADTIATVRELRSADFGGFLRSGAFTRTYPGDPLEWRTDPEQRFLVSPLSHLWRALENRRHSLGDVAIIRNGLQIKTDDTSSVSDDRTQQHNQPFVDRLDALRPFALLVGKGLLASRWIEYGEQLHRARDPRIFESSKVLINATRNPGSAWRLVAAMAREPLYFSDNFHAVLPNSSDVSVEQLAAVLNSPLANAWFDSHCRKRKVVIKVLEKMPFPRFDEALGKQINNAVKEMERAAISKWKKASEGMFYDGLVDTSDTSKLLAEIDRMVFDAYGLSRDERRHLQALMATDKRPA